MDLKTVLTLVAVVLAAIPSVPMDATGAHKEFDVLAIFAFGDSLGDAGTNSFIPQASARADFLPCGKTFFRKPTGRFTNCRTVVDFTECDGQAPDHFMLFHELSTGWCSNHVSNTALMNLQRVKTAQKLDLPLTPPFLKPHASFTKGVNFASGGRGLLDSTSADDFVSPRPIPRVSRLRIESASCFIGKALENNGSTSAVRCD
uniref:GDSL esterase/lipase n=1 Tax=Physcomitrium patens TaxID=3218 RepID=A0A7I4A2S3_PHYPA|nr:GDSL esterase/lipase At1g71250-like [Physcomitrium patens]|eukprot:XP_024386089.1 GDSL esterase/lipase At1g71250-like [Physcomitrella patens]